VKIPGKFLSVGPQDTAYRPSEYRADIEDETKKSFVAF